MTTISLEAPRDVPAREALLDAAFGAKRRRKTSERLRRGRLPAAGLAYAAHDAGGGLAGTLRLWNVAAGTAGDALLLGPLAVDARCRSNGLGASLMRRAIADAKALGHRAILLVGDEAYYKRFGFSRAAAGDLRLPGAVDLARFLALELAPGALEGATGLVQAAGRLAPAPAVERIAA